MLERTAYLEVLREVIFPVQSEHRLARHTIVCVALQRHIDCRTRIDDALVEYCYLARAVIDAVIRAFCQRYATGRHHHRTLRNVICSQ